MKKHVFNIFLPFQGFLLAVLFCFLNEEVGIILRSEFYEHISIVF